MEIVNYRAFVPEAEKLLNDQADIFIYRSGVLILSSVREITTKLVEFALSLYNRTQYRGADKSLARPTSQCILFDSENISFDSSLVIYIYIVLIFL